MKENFKKIVLNNWLFILMIIILQVKSMLLLSMLRTTNSSSINFSTMYFGTPAIGSHLFIIILILSFMYLFKYRGKTWVALIIDLIITLLFISDIWYYRNNGTFLSIRHLLHPEIFNPTGKSLFNFKSVDLLFFIDFIFFFALFKFDKIRKYKDNSKLGKRILKTAIIFLISSLIIFSYHYTIDVKGNVPGKSFLSLSWAPFQTISDMSPLGYHGFDLSYFPGNNKQLSNSDVAEVETWLNNNKEDIPDNEYFELLKGKNLIAIQVESLENFVINQKVYGQEITPTLNKLLSNSLYFDNIYEQNNSGTSSDADLMVNTGMLPITNAATSFAYPSRTLTTLPSILEKNGYTTVSAHPEVAGSWNWGEVHHSLLKFQNSYTLYDFNEDEIIGLGISDKSYLTQLATKAGNLKQPFYLFTVTLTNHGPFEIDDAHTTIKIPSEIEGTLIGQYFKTVRYTDEAIKMFMDKLKEEGRFDDTVFVIYGDHAGPNKYYKEQLKDVNFDGNYWKLDEKKVPLIIYNPSIQGKTIETKGGLIDVMPTVSYLLGVNDGSLRNVIGRNLLNTNRNIVALPGGEVAGEAKSQDELNHVKQSYDISTKIIRSDYFKNS